MNIIKGPPPNFSQILKALPKANTPGTIFAYYPNVYVLGHSNISDALKAHESVHFKQQKNIGVDKWWDQYLVDKNFRFDQELQAHIAEYKYILEHGARAERRQAMKTIVNRLSSPLYSLGKSKNELTTIILLQTGQRL